MNGFEFGYTEDGKPGFREAGADTFTPFSSSNPYLRYDNDTKYVQAMDLNGNWKNIASVTSLPLPASLDFLTPARPLSWAGSCLSSVSEGVVVGGRQVPTSSGYGDIYMTEDVNISGTSPTVRIKGTCASSHEGTGMTRWFIDISVNNESWTQLTEGATAWAEGTQSIAFDQTISLTPYIAQNVRFRIRSVSGGSGQSPNSTVSSITAMYFDFK